MKKTLFLVILTLSCFAATAQPLLPTANYWVFFKGKDLGNDPHKDFAPEALARRARMGIPFPMVEDFAVTPKYIQTVATGVVELRHTLRWFNAVTVTATPQQIACIQQLPFVLEVAPMVEMESHLAAMEDEEQAGDDSTKLHKLFENQRELVHQQALEDAGLTGKGIRIAIFDAGFSGADTHTAFAHLHANHQIKATKDFVAHNDDVYAHSNHGTAVLSCIAGMYEGKRIGAAVEAEFLLARTERNLREPASEEDNWMAAMEWADLNGADVISSSLGYIKRYTYSDMTGSKTLVARAAAMGVRKGMLVVLSAGNEGGNKFHFVSTPADADSVLTVGASYPMMVYRMPFSSFGPNYNGVMKPEISGPGYVLAANKKGAYKPIAGTSFACPIVAGMAACFMQKWHNETNMQIKKRIMEAGSTYPYFDYGLGYGVLDAQIALQDGPVSHKPTFKVERRSDTLWVKIDPKAMYADSAKYKSGKPFSYHFRKGDGSLTSFNTVLLGQKNLRFGLPSPSQGGLKTEMWFQGYLWREGEE